MSAIMISQVRITDPEAFQEYFAETQKVAANFNTEVLFRGKMTGALNGEPQPHQMIVIVKFPDMATIEAWHRSPEYQTLIPLREKGSEQLMVTYEDVA